MMVPPSPDIMPPLAGACCWTGAGACLGAGLGAGLGGAAAALLGPLLNIPPPDDLFPELDLPPPLGIFIRQILIIKFH